MTDILVTNCVANARILTDESSIYNKNIKTGDYTWFDIRREPYNLEAKVVLDWKVNPISVEDRIATVVAHKQLGENNATRLVKLPFRIAKSIIFGADCEWRKKTMLIVNN